MSVLFVGVSRMLITAKRLRQVDFDPHLIAARVKKAIELAETAGFQFIGAVSTTSSLPYLIVYAQCQAAYSQAIFPVELRIWDDGIVQLLVRPDELSDKSLFVVRILADGFVSQTMNFHKYLHS